MVTETEVCVTGSFPVLTRTSYWRSAGTKTFLLSMNNVSHKPALFHGSFRVKMLFSKLIWSWAGFKRFSASVR